MKKTSHFFAFLGRVPFRVTLAWSLVILGLFTSPAGWAASSCQNLLQVQQGAVRRHIGPEIFAVEVPKYNYSFQGSLNDEGTLSISAFLSFSEFGVRSHLRGDDLYRKMIEHFGVEKIKKIKGVWFDGTNYDRFFELLKAGHSKEEAALGTWSGRQAQKYGFNKGLFTADGGLLSVKEEVGTRTNPVDLSFW